MSSDDLSNKLARAVTQTVARNGDRQECMSPYDLFHAVRSQFRLTAEEEEAVHKTQIGEGRTTLAVDSKTYDTRHIAVRVYIEDGQDPTKVAEEIFDVTGRDIYQNPYASTFLVSMTDPYRDDDGVYVTDCIVASHHDFSQAYEICSSTMTEHQLKLGKGVHDPEVIIDRAARIAFERILTDLSISGMITGVMPANLSDVEQRIAMQSSGEISQTGSSFGFTMP